MDVKRNFELPCICMRKPSLLKCKNKQCTFVSSGGRMRKSCPSHPKLTFLMDLVHCPLCQNDCEEFYENGQLYDARDEGMQFKNQQNSVIEDRVKFRPMLSKKSKPPRIPRLSDQSDQIHKQKNKKQSI